VRAPLITIRTTLAALAVAAGITALGAERWPGAIASGDISGWLPWAELGTLIAVTGFIAFAHAIGPRDVRGSS
jgi:hypothetical protein